MSITFDLAEMRDDPKWGRVCDQLDTEQQINLSNSNGLFVLQTVGLPVEYCAYLEPVEVPAALAKVRAEIARIGTVSCPSEQTGYLASRLPMFERLFSRAVSEAKGVSWA